MQCEQIIGTERCQGEAVAHLTVKKYRGVRYTLVACPLCWQAIIEKQGHHIVFARPVIHKEED